MWQKYEKLQAHLRKPKIVNPLSTNTSREMKMENKKKMLVLRQDSNPHSKIRNLDCSRCALGSGEAMLVKAS